MCKICWTVSALLVVVIATMAYMFIVRGSVTQGDDGRTAILLSSGERDLVLAEMRGFLESIQAITTGIAEKDVKTISVAAKKSGMTAAHGVPAPLMAKLPVEVKTLGLSTHQAFDALAVEAEDMGDLQIILIRLGELMLNCTTCHAGYRIDIEDAQVK